MPSSKSLLISLAVVCLISIVGSGAVYSQNDGTDAKPVDLIPDVEQAARVNNNTVGLVFSNDELANLAIEDLGHKIKENANIRLVPILGNNDVQSVYDLLFLKGVEAAVFRSDAVEYVERRGNFPTVRNVVNAILAVHQDKILILANKDITSVDSLDGKKVAVGPYASGEYITMSVMSDILGIEPEYVFSNTLDGLEQLRAGEVSALVYHFHVGHEHDEATEEDPPKYPIFSAVHEFDASETVHALPLPTDNQAMQAIYRPSLLTPNDLPNLIQDGSGVQTFTVDTLLAAYRWRPENPRYTKSSRFVDAFIESIDQLKEGDQQEFWGDLDVNAPVHGVSRLAMVDEILILRERQAEQEEQERVASIELAKENERAAKIARLTAQREQILKLLDQKITNASDLEELQALLDEINSFAGRLD